jgi:O-acetyl-ADP-ribose deacetylase (regulator of RNase III)
MGAGRPNVGRLARDRGIRAVIKIDVVVGDLTRMPVEAIVNAANNELWMGGGVAGAIKAGGGAEIEREAMAQGPIEPGAAVATWAGRLPPPIRWVIHAATMPATTLQTDERLIRAATRSALKKADDVGAASVALPALGTGVGGFAIERAARVMAEEAVAFGRTAQSVERVVLVARSEEARRAFEEALEEVLTSV